MSRDKDKRASARGRRRDTRLTLRSLADALRFLAAPEPAPGCASAFQVGIPSVARTQRATDPDDNACATTTCANRVCEPLCARSHVLWALLWATNASLSAARATQGKHVGRSTTGGLLLADECSRAEQEEPSQRQLKSSDRHPHLELQSLHRSVSLSPSSADLALTRWATLSPCLPHHRHCGVNAHGVRA